MYANLSYDEASPSGLVWAVSRGPRKAGAVAGCLESDGYWSVRVDRVLTPAHVIVWVLHNGPVPEGMVVDHKDNNHVNNAINNLRLATRGQNNCNTPTRKDNTLGVKGVSPWRGDKFRASINHAGKNYSKIFCELDAAAAWVADKRKELHGEFQRHS